MPELDELDRVIMRGMVAMSRTHPDVATVVIMVGATKVTPQQRAGADAMLGLAQSVAALVPRGTGVVVASLTEHEFWRADYGDKLLVKRCLECGDELVGPVMKLERLTRNPGSLVGGQTVVCLRFCDRHPTM